MAKLTQGKNLPHESRLPDRVRHAREAAHLTKSDVAERTRLSLSYVGRIENGKALPSPVALDALARSLRVRREWLVTGKGEMIAAEPSAPYRTRTSETWTAVLRPVLAGTPLEDAIPDHTNDPTGDTDKAWAQLAEDRKRDVVDVLRRMATVAIVIERTLPQPVAEALNNELATKVTEYLADAF